MRPIAGVVVEVNKKSILIELETGVLITTNNQHGLHFGQKCWVTYDFTKMEVCHVFKDDPTRRLKQDNTEEVMIEEGGEDEEILEDEDSGALPPEFDEVWGFWNSDSGILELP